MKAKIAYPTSVKASRAYCVPEAGMPVFSQIVTRGPRVGQVEVRVI